MPRPLMRSTLFALTLAILALAAAPPSAHASNNFCIWVYFPGAGLILICKTITPLEPDVPCPLEPIDEEDVVLCPPGSIGSGPINAHIGNNGDAGIFGVGLGIVHPDPSNPDSVFAAPVDTDDWTTAIVPASAWDSGDFAISTEAGWSVPALGSFADTFGPDATHAVIHWGELTGTGPFLPNQQQVLTLYGMDNGDVTYVLLGDGAVLGSGDAPPYTGPVAAEEASWSELKALYR